MLVFRISSPIIVSQNYDASCDLELHDLIVTSVTSPPLGRHPITRRNSNYMGSCQSPSGYSIGWIMPEIWLRFILNEGMVGDVSPAIRLLAGQRQTSVMVCSFCGQTRLRRNTSHLPPLRNMHDILIQLLSVGFPETGHWSSCRCSLEGPVLSSGWRAQNLPRQFRGSIEPPFSICPTTKMLGIPKQKFLERRGYHIGVIQHPYARPHVRPGRVLQIYGGRR